LKQVLGFGRKEKRHKGEESEGATPTSFISPTNQRGTQTNFKNVFILYFRGDERKLMVRRSLTGLPASAAV